jgi:phage terminase large subunit-like protein
MVLSEKPENDWDNPIFHAEPETPKPWVEYYPQSAIKGKLLTIDDLEFKDHWKEFHLWADEWDCTCKENNKTKWCYCEDTKPSAKGSQW